MCGALELLDGRKRVRHAVLACHATSLGESLREASTAVIAELPNERRTVLMCVERDPEACRGAPAKNLDLRELSKAKARS
jgi:hypothetical protein